VQLHNEKDLTRPAVLEVITPTEVRLTISEGRYHQVKRMFAAVGNRVVGLHRERIGAIALDDDLEPGEYRPLTAEEIASVGLPSRAVRPVRAAAKIASVTPCFCIVFSMAIPLAMAIHAGTRVVIN
jgi:hypothetical protein